MPTQDDIAAAVAAYDSANPIAPLPRNTVRLLVAMFRKERRLPAEPGRHCSTWLQPKAASRHAELPRPGRVIILESQVGQCVRYLPSARAARVAMRNVRR
jgi:hypothetical protein